MAGIVRRIDNLGRIVIPKEIRRSLKIKEGEAIDIDINDSKIVLKRYSNFLDIQNILDVIISVCGKKLDKDIIIFDNNNIVSQYCKSINNIVGKEISNKLSTYIIERKNNYNYDGKLNILENLELDGKFMMTSIIPNGDVVGGVLLYSENLDFLSSDTLIMDIINNILVKYIEE